jgi:metal-responsive CopG/Arc/MetJ family transcriptional regulator
MSGMKHNFSITMDQKLYRQIETIRGREKRSTFIEHLIIQGLNNYKKEEMQSAKKAPAIFQAHTGLSSEIP